MAQAQLKPVKLALSDAELEIVARVAERLLAARPLNRAGTVPHRRRAGSGLEFMDYRDYVAGDELRHIDWRASARSRGLKLRRYHEEASSQWLLCLDRSASMSVNDGEKWRHAAEIAAAFAYVLLALSARVGLVAFSRGIDAVCPPGRGQRHYARILETLVADPADERGGGSALGACIRAVEPDSGVIVLSDFLRPDAMRPDLGLLSRAAGGVQALKICAERDFDRLPRAELTIRDAENGEAQELAWNETTRRAARDSFEAHTQRWERTCRDLAIPCSTSFTGEGWKQALLRHLTTLGGRRRA